MRKIIGIGVAAAASALLLAGCSGGSTAEQTADSSAELVIWTDQEREAAITAAAKAFEEETGAKVTLVQKNFEDLRNDFISQVPTGEGPDITVGSHGLGSGRSSPRVSWTRSTWARRPPSSNRSRSRR